MIAKVVVCLQLSLEVRQHNLPGLLLWSAGDHADSSLTKETDSPLSHASGNHKVNAQAMQPLGQRARFVGRRSLHIHACDFFLLHISFYDSKLLAMEE